MFELSSITGGQSTLTRLAGGLHYVAPSHFFQRPSTLIDVIERERIQVVSVPPSTLPIVTRLLRDAAGRDLSSIETFSLGSELINVAGVNELLSALQDVGCSDVKMSVGYGMTEIGLICGKVYDRDGIEGLSASEPMPLGGAWEGRSIRVVDPAGNTCPTGSVGEVEVLTEEPVFVEYVGDPDATADAVTADGWFRTKDLGLVHDGSLTLVGRRSGAPSDEVLRAARLEAQLRTTPGVAVGQVWLHPTDGRYEVVYVAEESLGPSASRDLQSALETPLQREVDLVGTVRRVAAEDLPFTRTGKIHRPSLAGVPTQEMPTPDHPDAPAIRHDVESAWMRSLGLSDVDTRRHTYADAGGTSLGLLGLVAAIEATYGRHLPLGDFLGHPTVEGLIAATTAAVLEPDLDRREADGPAFVRALLGTWPGEAVADAPHLRVANGRGSARPLVWIFNWEHEYRRLIAAMGGEQPVYASRSFVALPGIGYDPASVAAMAEVLVDDLGAAGILRQRPVLGGNCQAAILVLELAALLSERGHPVDRLVLLDAVPTERRYEGPTTVLIGRDDVHSLASVGADDLRRLGADHGAYFVEPGVSELAGLLAEFTRAPRPRRRWRRPVRQRGST
jgi:acyl carrier protein